MRQANIVNKIAAEERRDVKKKKKTQSYKFFFSMLICEP